MAGSAPRAQDGKKAARIEIIPLIDVIFFLLATFVLFYLMIVFALSWGTTALHYSRSSSARSTC